MSSERLRTQCMFESIMISRFSIDSFSDLKGSDIKNYNLIGTDISIFGDTLRKDALDFYYKGLISLCEAMLSLRNKGWSWSTVKLYYSVFYFLRASLCIKGIGFVRKARDLFYFSLAENNNFIKINHPDHKAAIDVYVNLFKFSDALQSNNIGDRNCYEWVMLQRENINYKYRTFFEPSVPEIWQTIENSLEEEGLDYWINQYLSKPIYSFLDEHAILAVPLQRHALTVSELFDSDISGIIIPEKTYKVKTLITENDCLSFLNQYF